MKRIALFLATNIAILLVLSIALRLLGIERILDEAGVGRGPVRLFMSHPPIEERIAALRSTAL